MLYGLLISMFSALQIFYMHDILIVLYFNVFSNITLLWFIKSIVL
jgi:hypothetical protein